MGIIEHATKNVNRGRGLLTSGAITVMILFLFSCGESDNTAKSLNIAVAANMQFAMDSIAKVYEAKQGVKLNLSHSSSGMLTSQIIEGAPFDAFVSANLSYPKKLEEEGFATSIETYAFGRLVLVYSVAGDFKDVEAVLLSADIKRIGVANKVTAPYGIASLEYLTHIDKTRFKDKIVFGESIGQVNQYLKTVQQSYVKRNNL